MKKEQLIQMIEAYADAKSANNSYLIGLVAQQLSEAINLLIPNEEEEDIQKGPGTKVTRTK